ncbi:hypothetical protein PSTG_09092 [Puccinia striiformis f. sp. tritici PST-78]|uniref:Calponin-homology (CH) domain-containing protein n=1 Tax=Puccinia striiformis f. sp. tritici PST-78 TaxID=1165861 RepID=A0A0L0VEJ3_9BASI|nr:hypothetical protein PSTG_09092 [Puccinia striiformis f. sp. tritici PST-78]
MASLPFPSSSPPPTPTTTTTTTTTNELSSPGNMEQQNTNRPRMAYYTPMNPRQFSSSAAKRDSVMALGSIAHLQHYFVRNGLATKNRNATHRNGILALPGADQLAEEDEQNLPPEPAPPPPKPSQPQFPAGRALPNLSDLESARQEVMAQLDQVCQSWGLVQLAATRAPSVASNADEELHLPSSSSPSLSAAGSGNLQLSIPHSTDLENEGFIINLISLTTHAVRSVQKFIITIPDPDIFSSTNISSLGGDLQRRMSHLELSTAARPKISRPGLFLGSASSRTSSPSRPDSPQLNANRRTSSTFDPFAIFKKRAVFGPVLSTQSPSTLSSPTNNHNNHHHHHHKDDPLTILRKMSLEVLTCLKNIEHKFRIPGSATPMEEEFGAAKLGQINEDEEEEGEGETVLVLPSMGWEYRQDISLDHLRNEALIVKDWLECVDGILEGLKIITAGSNRHNRNRNRHIKKIKKKKSDLNLLSPTITKPTKTFKKKKSFTSSSLSPEGTIKKEKNVFKKIMNSTKFQTSPTSTKSTKNKQQQQQIVPAISLEEEHDHLEEHDEGSEEYQDEYQEHEDDDDDEYDDDEEEGNEECLPDWARNDRFISLNNIDDQSPSSTKEEDLQLARLFNCLISHLPVDLLVHLVPPVGENGSKIGFLDSLSDGTLLCIAYNIVLRKSQRPWGFIPVESIHNLAVDQSVCTGLNNLEIDDDKTSSTLGGGAGAGGGPNKIGITFRRMENIKVWSAALKLRYLIKGEIPTTKSSPPNSNATTHHQHQQQLDPNSSPSHHHHHHLNHTKFDPKSIAKKSDDWDHALLYMILKWLESVKNEKREEVLFSK